MAYYIYIGILYVIYNYINLHIHEQDDLESSDGPLSQSVVAVYVHWYRSEIQIMQKTPKAPYDPDIVSENFI